MAVSNNNIQKGKQEMRRRVARGCQRGHGTL